MGTRAFGHIVRSIPPGCVTNPAGTTVVTNSYIIELPGIIYAQISYYFQTKVATQWFDDFIVIILALLSTGKTAHSVSLVSFAYMEVPIDPDLDSQMSGTNPVDFIIQPVLVRNHKYRDRF
jgi:hypothetical protein